MGPAAVRHRGAAVVAGTPSGGRGGREGVCVCVVARVCLGVAWKKKLISPPALLAVGVQPSENLFLLTISLVQIPGVSDVRF